MKFRNGCYTFFVITVIIVVIFGAMTTSVQGSCVARRPDGSCKDGTSPTTTPRPRKRYGGHGGGHHGIGGPCYGNTKKDPTGRCRKLLH